MNKYVQQLIEAEKRRFEIYNFVKEGNSYMKTAIKFGITPARVSQIIKRVREHEKPNL